MLSELVCDMETNTYYVMFDKWPIYSGRKLTTKYKQNNITLLSQSITQREIHQMGHKLNRETTPPQRNIQHVDPSQDEKIK